MEPRGETRRKIKPRCIVNYSTSRRSAIDAYGWTSKGREHTGNQPLVVHFLRSENSSHGLMGNVLLRPFAQRRLQSPAI